MKRGLKNRLRDGEAFDRLVEEHYDDVLAYCRRHAPFYDDAPDVAQEAFLRFVRSGRSPLDGKPLAYLFTIARNLCIDAARARRLPVGPLDVDVPDGSPDADPAMAIGDGEVGRWLTRSPLSCAMWWSCASTRGSKWARSRTCWECRGSR